MDRGESLPATTLSVTIDRPADDLYGLVWRPESFPLWASGLADASLRQDGATWIAAGPDGPVRIRFTGRNAFGVMDHWVETGAAKVFVPLRIIPNGRGCEVLLTLFRQPGVTDDRLAADADWVRRDLAALKALAERERG